MSIVLVVKMALLRQDTASDLLSGQFSQATGFGIVGIRATLSEEWS